MFRILTLSFFITLFGLIHPGHGVDFRTKNVSYWYNPDGLQVRSVVSQSNDDLRIFLELVNDSISIDRIRFLIQNDFEDPNHQELEVVPSILFENPYRLILELRPPISNEQLLVIEYAADDTSQFFPIELQRGNQPFPPFYFIDRDSLPHFKPYIVPDQKIIQLTSSKLFAYQYRESFPPADPPMGIIQDISPTLDIDSVVALEEYAFLPGYFYFIQEDTLGTKGIARYCGETYYPRTRRLQELIEPITYITRQSEISNIQTATDIKKAFDDFWLRLYPNQRDARVAIRNFYRRIQQVNARYTDYKPGWKTDRGVVALMYGAPSNVVRSNNEEEWAFPDGTSFKFRILSNLFTPNLYILVRDEDYRDSWIQRVTLIRENG
jgi:GWxTD domain-containing protein